jgi:hypothetical protein
MVGNSATYAEADWMKYVAREFAAPLGYNRNLL